MFKQTVNQKPITVRACSNKRMEGIVYNAKQSKTLRQQTQWLNLQDASFEVTFIELILSYIDISAF